jgi:ATP-binding cassette subfamily B protein
MFVSFATMLIQKLEQVVSFVNNVFSGGSATNGSTVLDAVGRGARSPRRD